MPGQHNVSTPGYAPQTLDCVSSRLDCLGDGVNDEVARGRDGASVDDKVAKGRDRANVDNKVVRGRVGMAAGIVIIPGIRNVAELRR